jgi:hypothetical protein
MILRACTFHGRKLSVFLVFLGGLWVLSPFAFAQNCSTVFNGFHQLGGQASKILQIRTSLSQDQRRRLREAPTMHAGQERSALEIEVGSSSAIRLVDTHSGTIREVLEASEKKSLPRWLKKFARTYGYDQNGDQGIREIPWDHLSETQKLQLLRYSTEGKPVRESPALARLARQIPGIRIKDEIHIFLIKPVYVEGKTYGPGVTRIPLRKLFENSVQYGDPEQPHDHMYFELHRRSREPGEESFLETLALVEALKLDLASIHVHDLRSFKDINVPNNSGHKTSDHLIKAYQTMILLEGAHLLNEMLYLVLAKAPIQDKVSNDLIKKPQKDDGIATRASRAEEKVMGFLEQRFKERSKSPWREQVAKRFWLEYGKRYISNRHTSFASLKAKTFPVFADAMTSAIQHGTADFEKRFKGGWVVPRAGGVYGDHGILGVEFRGYVSKMEPQIYRDFIEGVRYNLTFLEGFYPKEDLRTWVTAMSEMSKKEEETWKISDYARYHQEDWTVFKKKSHPQIIERLTDQDWVKLEELAKDHIEIEMLLFNWFGHPLFIFQPREFKIRILRAQLKALDAISSGQATPTDTVREFLLESGLFLELSNRFHLEILP